MNKAAQIALETARRAEIERLKKENAELRRKLTELLPILEEIVEQTKPDRD